MIRKTYSLLFWPSKVKEEVLEWVSYLDVIIEERLIYDNNDRKIRYDCITFLHEEDELAFKLKFRNAV